MNNLVISNSIRFIILILVQVLVLDNVHFLGYITPYIYILFILLFPLNANRSVLLIASFLLGFSVDIFEGSGGIHAAACVCMAYTRSFALKSSFGVSYEYNVIKINEIPFGRRITYVGLLVFIHHTVLYVLEFFNFDHILLLLKTTLFSILFSSILIMISMVLFSRKSA